MLQIQTNNKGPVLLTRNAEDIILSCPDSTRIETAIQYGDMSFSTTLIPSEGLLRLRLEEMLKSLGCQVVFSDLSGIDGKQMDVPTVSISFTDPDSEESVTWESPVIEGGVDSPNPETILLSQWLTWRPQICKIQDNANVYLYCMVPTQYQEIKVTSVNVYIDVYTISSGLIRSIPYMTVGADDHPSILAINASYSQILKNVAISKLSDDGIVAFDVYATVRGEYLGVRLEKEATAKQRFILQRRSSDSVEFLFRNSFGVFDDIRSSGRVARKLSGKVTSFISSSKEFIQNNAADYTYEVDTGYIDTDRQLAQWEDFLKSSEHYITLPDGGIRKIIIEDPDTDSTRHQLGTVTFSFRMADKWKGRLFSNTELDYFDYDTAEL